MCARKIEVLRLNGFNNRFLLTAIFVFVIAFALLFAGCVQPESGNPSPTAKPTSVQTATPTPSATVTATATPSPVVSVSINQSSQPDEKNYSKTEVVTEFWTAINKKDFERAYFFVSRDFKSEDPNASSVEAFKQRLEHEFPTGVAFSNVAVANENPREVTFLLGARGATELKLRSRVLSFESGFWKIRVPYSSYGHYYNNYTKFVFNVVELSRYLERASNDFFSQMDSSLKTSPIELTVIDSVNRIYFGARSLVITGGGLPSGKGYSTIEIKFGPSYLVPSYTNSAQLSDRPFYFDFGDSVRSQGGNGGFFCNKGTGDLFVTIKTDSTMSQYYSGESNPMQPILEALSRACPP